MGWQPRKLVVVHRLQLQGINLGASQLTDKTLRLRLLSRPSKPVTEQKTLSLIASGAASIGGPRVSNTSWALRFLQGPHENAQKNAQLHCSWCLISPLNVGKSRSASGVAKASVCSTCHCREAGISSNAWCRYRPPAAGRIQPLLFRLTWACPKWPLLKHSTSSCCLLGSWRSKVQAAYGQKDIISSMIHR